ncbi:MAG: DUF4111 domain-containing protein [candidate division Zixibacteria bacterium]|nr:DUF4111 domain-containing protein [candidate division Zixibacteria bacterium]
MSQEKQIRQIGETFRQGLFSILGKKLHAAYILGAAAFPDPVPTGDVDFQVILTAALTEDERTRLEALHTDIAELYPPLGVEMDGYYILLSDARSSAPPRSQMWTRAVDYSWALHREHLRGGRRIILHGPDPKGIHPPATWPEIEEALESEMDFVRRHTDKYPDYCILNLCRLMYSYETHDVVVSKARASDWATGRLPRWAVLIQTAKRCYGRAGTDDRARMQAQVAAFLDIAEAHIASSKNSR